MLTKLRGLLVGRGGGPQSSRFIVESRVIVRLDAVLINKDNQLYYTEEVEMWTLSGGGDFGCLFYKIN